jgi:hypothetical protein
MQIEFLYWEECPSHGQALARLREILAEEHLTAAVNMIEVTRDEQAQILRFPGSPTIRVNGADLFPVPGEPYGLTCRIYTTSDGRVTPLPTKEMIRGALRAALTRRQNAESRTQKEE